MHFPHAETERLNFVSREGGMQSLITVADLYELCCERYLAVVSCTNGL